MTQGWTYAVKTYSHRRKLLQWKKKGWTPRLNLCRLTCIYGCIFLYTSMDTPDNHSMWIFPLSIHFQFMGCSLMALLSTNNCYRTTIFGAWMHSMFTNHIFKPVTTNCMQRSGSETRLVLDILHVTQECLKDIMGLIMHLLSQVILMHPLNNYTGAIFFRPSPVIQHFECRDVR